MTSDWRDIALGNVCSKIGSGATPRGGKETYRGGATALVRSQNVHNDRFSRNGLAFIDDVQATELRSVAVEEGDVLLNITGDSVARCCQVDPGVLPARVNQHVAIIRPRAGELEADFLRYALITPRMQARLLALASAGATRNALTKAMLDSLVISAPPLATQRSIARILGALDDKIELNRKTNETLEAMARALFQSWFVDFDPVRAKMEGRQPEGMDAETAKLFPPKLASQSGQALPATWRIGRLGDAVEILDSRRIPLSARQREERPGRFPYHGAAGVMGFVDDYLFDGVHVLVGEDGSVVTPAGAPVLQYVEGKFWVNNHAHVLRGNKVSEEHILLALERTDVRPYVTGAVQPKLNQANLKSIPFLFAGSEINAAFARSVSPAFARIRANLAESRTLAALRDALLPKLLSGELRVPDAERAVSAAL